MSKIRITALRAAPPAFHGQIRDLAVRWVLEEIGADYEVQLVDDDARRGPNHRALHPFGKVPTFEGDGITLFESGAIALHLAESRGQLLPKEPAARAHAKAWLFGALNSMDPDVIALGDIDHWAPAEAWGIARRPGIVAMVRERLAVVNTAVSSQDYLAGEFSVADILMIQVLRQLRHTQLIEELPALTAWRERCQSRPAFARALAAQLRDLGAIT